MRCWYTRWQMSNALDGAVASRFAARHAAHCASCQAFGRALGSLHGRLAREADTAAAPPPAPRRSRTPWLVGGPLAAGAAVAIAVAINVGGAPPTPVPPPFRPTAPEEAAIEPIRVTGLADQVTHLLADTPLDTELDNLVHDGRRGLQAVLATGGLR